MFYDLLLLFAWVFIPWLVLFTILERSFDGPLFQAVVYLQIGAFYTYFWRLKGQTLGMQVWKIRTVTDTGEVLTFGDCVVRYFFATFSIVCIGLGFLWILFDPERLAWHDRASGTRVIFLGKDAYQHGALRQDENATSDSAAKKNDQAEKPPA